MRPVLSALLALSAFAAGWVPGEAPRRAAAQEPLSAAIDRLIAARAEGHPAAARVDDAGFVRRVYLDLLGRVPSTAEWRTFLADPSPDRRARCIDQLLASPEHPQRMQDLFHAILMERRGDHPDWQNYLRTSFAANKPWDVMVREMLAPQADDEPQRGAGFFLSKRLESYGQNPVDHPGLTRDVGRLFLGVDLQCAQCHNHLFVEDYKQHDFQGLFAVYQGLAVRTDVKFPAVKEKPLAKKLEFVSVFDPTKFETGPRIPFGQELEIRGEPAYSPLAELAGALTAGEHALFARNIANRVWFVLLGRGLVHPLDLAHAKNPPSHPELLDLLARELVSHRFDLRWLLSEIARSETYQRSSAQPSDAPAPPERFLVGQEKRILAEALLASVLVATGEWERVRLTGDAAKTAPPGPTLDQLRTDFLTAFTNPAREPEVEFDASVKGALYLMNGERFLALLAPRPGNLAERLLKIDDPAARAEELYVATLSRRPTPAETTEANEFLTRYGARRETGVRDLIWALLTSAEFLANH